MSHIIKAACHLIKVNEAVITGVYDCQASPEHINSDTSCFLLRYQDIDLALLKTLQEFSACKVICLALIYLVSDFASQDLNSIEQLGCDLSALFDFV